MGILPLEFLPGEGVAPLGLTGRETITISGLAEMQPGGRLTVTVSGGESAGRTFEALSRVDSAGELAYLRHGGILPFVLRKALAGRPGHRPR
jgi:aconitate hydratase